MKLIKCTFAVLVALLALLTGSPTSVGQDVDKPAPPVGIFASGREYDQFMGSIKGLAYGENGSPELRAMIPMLNDIVLERPIGSTASQYQSSGETLGLLSSPAVREEVEMLDDQYREIRQAAQDVRRRSAMMLRELDFSDRDRVIEQIRKIREDSAQQIESVLLPRQIQRLKQIQMQTLLRRRSLVDVLASDPFKSDLQISEAQIDDLRNEEKKIQKELEREIAKLREKARQRLIGKLNQKQQTEVEGLFGDAFDFPARQLDKRPRKSGGAKRDKYGKF